MTNELQGQPSLRVLVLGSFIQAHWWKVARLPLAGESCLASALCTELGGKGLNVGIGVHRLGVAVDIFLGVGRDAAAREVCSLLEAEGISTTQVHTLGETSGHGAGFVAANGDNSIAVFPGANLLLGTREIQQASPLFSTGTLVYGQLETSLEAVQAAFGLARNHGVMTVLNPSPMRVLGQELLGVTSTLVLNWTEACQLLAGAVVEMPPSLQSCAALLQPQVVQFRQRWPGDWMVVTAGALGSMGFARDGETVCALPARPHAQGDSAGAGDAFSAGLCVALAQGQPMRQALQLANACGAALASGHGVLEHLPTMATLQKWGYQADRLSR